MSALDSVFAPAPQSFLASRIVLSLLAVGALSVLSSCSTPPTHEPSTPAPIPSVWDLRRLSEPPIVTLGATNGLTQEVFYPGEPFNDKPTRVFAYLGRPAEPSKQRSPAMILVHGGGGRAFKSWAEHWAKRGYVALAMDLGGHGPKDRLPDGGPDQSDATKFRSFTRDQAKDMWTYHAVAAVIRGHNWVRSLPEVDPNRIGLTGISWGGYLTCIVAGVDPRFKVAVPVYGCGFLGENSVWKDKALAAMNPEARALWLELFDPSAYLTNVRCPILFVNGTTDFAYPLDSYQKSYRLVPEKWRHLAVTVGRPHGHIWTFPEVDTFVASVLRPPAPWLRLGPTQIAGNEARATLSTPVAVAEPTLCFTTDSGPWNERKWQKSPAQAEGNLLRAALPTPTPRVAFLTVRLASGAEVSSEHYEWPSAAPR